MPRDRKPRPTDAPGPPPGEKELHAAAISYLARYATTRSGLLRILDRTLLRWARKAELAGTDTAGAVSSGREVARGIVARLAQAGVVDDAAFAAQRARSLVRAGRSRRAVAAHLAAHGVDPNVTQSVLPADADQELAAALALARRRRIGPFRDSPCDAPADAREAAVLARAGFSRDVALRALRMAPDQAEAWVLRLKQGEYVP